jgi:hypothetical protein
MSIHEADTPPVDNPQLAAPPPETSKYNPKARPWPEEPTPAEPVAPMSPPPPVPGPGS